MNEQYRKGLAMYASIKQRYITMFSEDVMMVRYVFLVGQFSAE